MSISHVNGELTTLLALFYGRPQELGCFEEVGADALEEPYQHLLAHPHHMTVTMEEYHRSLVDVQVLEKQTADNFYARRILLTRQSDSQVVQFGIMRLNFDHFSAAVRREIESQSAPLGRILIQHKVLEEIELLALWRVTAGPELCGLFNIPPEQTTYGRTAVIRCNHQPAVELLEIVTPQK